MHKMQCPMWCGWLVLLIGILFLLKDIGAWNFWGINWWTIVFLLMGICMTFKCCKK